MTATDRPALIEAMAAAMWAQRNDEEWEQVGNPWRGAFLHMAEVALAVVEARDADP